MSEHSGCSEQGFIGSGCSIVVVALHCASARANELTRVVEAGSARLFCEAHDVGI